MSNNEIKALAIPNDQTRYEQAIATALLLKTEQATVILDAFKPPK